MLAWLLACASTPDPGGEPVDTAPPDSADTDDTGDSALPAESVGVVVVGSGPAGLAAAWGAVEAGEASVLVLERAHVPATGLIYTGLLYGAATRWHTEAGVSDSVELAAADWEAFTGASAAPGTGARQFIEESAEVLEWLMLHHIPLGGLVSSSEGSVPRLVDVDFEDTDDRLALFMTDFPGELRADAEVTAPLIEDGRVVGVRWTDTLTGAEAEVRADAVVLAAGGFLRDLDAVGELRPDLVARGPVFETNLNSVGSTLPFLAQAGAGWEQPEQIGTYFHSVLDPRLPGAEALIVSSGGGFVLLGSDGRRFVADDALAAFDVLAAAPEGDVWLVTGGQRAEELRLGPPGYNWAVANVPEAYTVAEVQAWGSTDVLSEDTLDGLATATGLGPALVDEIVTFNERAAGGGVDPFGRDLGLEDIVSGPPWVALRLRPGLAKNFGGVATDLDGRVLDADGVVIPGLYAAGEVAGMVTGGGSGTGFSGSGGACYAGGRRAGRTAVED